MRQGLGASEADPMPSTLSACALLTALLVRAPTDARRLLGQLVHPLHCRR